MLKAEPLISIIIPAHNRVELLERAIRSALSQKQVSSEIIVVDDGSQPPVAELISKNLLSEITLIRNESRKNAAFSRNRGASFAGADIFAFLDSDDTWREDHLEIAVKLLRQHGSPSLYIASFSNYQAQDGVDSVIIQDAYEFKFGDGKDFRTSGFVCTRSLFESIKGFDPALDKHQDWDFALRAGLKTSIIYGPSSTVFLDTAAEERMSYQPNIRASAYFLEKHKAKMQTHHMGFFWGGVLKSCVMTGDKNLIESSKQLAVQYISVLDLPVNKYMFWYFPWLARFVVKLKLKFKNHKLPG